MSELMTTREVAEYLRIKERKVYDLVHEKRIPCARVTGKWLFPRDLIDAWIAHGTEFPDDLPGLLPSPPVAVGSHDPLFDWAIRESGCELAVLPGGSLDGLRRMAKGEASACGLHVLDAATGEYNLPLVSDTCHGLDLVLIEWARRKQGLIVAPGNPLAISSIRELVVSGARVVTRQAEAGSQILLSYLLETEGVELSDLRPLSQPARSETDLALAVLEGHADVGLGVESVARLFRLDFVPLHEERYDLLLRRRAYFEKPIQTLLAFARSPAMAERVSTMAGYDISNLGRVIWNSP